MCVYRLRRRRWQWRWPAEWHEDKRGDEYPRHDLKDLIKRGCECATPNDAGEFALRDCHCLDRIRCQATDVSRKSGNEVLCLGAALAKAFTHAGDVDARLVG